MRAGRTSHSINLLLLLAALCFASAVFAQTITTGGTNSTKGIRPLRISSIHGPALFRCLRPCCPWPTMVYQKAYDSCQIKGNSSATLPFDRMCRVDCGMKNMTFLNGTKIDYDKLRTKFMRAAGGLQSAANESVSECSAYVEKLNGTYPVAASAPNGTTICNAIAAVTWNCVRQKFVNKTCTSTAALDPQCSACFEKLKLVTPLDLLVN
ncbi:uncharacterized protein LOC132200902 isoform X2 [Neocloeon triangulifer]|uniref:uncharacterized protein LOC132200902 isoform X2 n=1 Tax=Neocloeon triangulifer TaxID=2078957 RepID=UPI00286F5EB9|nr:uncharacterized protein LOC132200902 isoform X2 [Neocloeon triangulifer]